MRGIRTLESRWPLEVALAALAAIGFALTFGVFHPLSSQSSHLVHGLQLADPSFLANDWLTSETADYHPVFSYLVSRLVELGVSVAGLGYLNVLVVAVGTLVLFAIAKTTARTTALAAYLLSVGLMTYDRTRSIAGTSVFTHVLQPSTAASVGLLLAILFYLRGRHLISGLLLGIGGLFHAEVLVLGLPVFLVSHMLAGRGRLASRLAQQLGPPSLALLPNLPFFASALAAPEAPSARDIILAIRAPHDFFPGSFSDSIPFLVWTFLGLASLRFLTQDDATHRRLGALYSSLTLTLWAAAAFTTLVFVPQVAQLFVWRLAPYLTVLAQLMSSVVVVGLLSESRLGSAERSFLMAVWIGLVAVLACEQNPDASPALLLLATAVCAVFSLLPDRPAAAIRRWTLSALWLPACALVVLWITCQPVLAEWASQPRGVSRREGGLFAWASQTPPGSLFLVPPTLESFRLGARRAIVADWSSRPTKADDVVEWYRRLGAVSGRPGFQTLSDLEGGYEGMSLQRLQSLAVEFGLDFAVFEKPGPEEVIRRRRIAFEDDAFVVVGIP